MRIKSLSFDGFGCFPRGIAVELQTGLNVILGPNGSGKSTLVQGLIGILFGLRDKDHEAACRPKRPHRGYAGQIVLVSSAGEHTIRRDFASHRVVVTRKTGAGEAVLYQGEPDPRGQSEELLRYLTVIEEITGLADRDMAVRTLFMQQGELETAIDERVRHLLSGTRRGDYEQVLERLEERYFELTRENPWGRRKKGARNIEQLNERLAGLTERRDRARAARDASTRLAAEIDALRADLERFRADGAVQGALFASYNEFLALNRERSDLEKRLTTLREEKETVKTLVADYRRIEDELWPRFEHFRKAGPEFAEVMRLQALVSRDVQVMEEDLRRREGELAKTPWPHNFRLGLIAGSATTIVTVGSLSLAGWPLFGVTLGMALGIVAFSVVYVRGKGKEKQRMRLEAHVLELTQRLDSQKGQQAAVEKVMREVVGERPFKDLPEEYSHFVEKQSLLTRCEQILESHRSLADVEADYDAVFQKLKVVDARARDLIARSPYLADADQNLSEAEQKLESSRSGRDQALSQAVALEERLGELKLRQARFEGTSSEDVESLEEEISEGLDSRTRLESRRDALRLAIEVLRESIQEFHESHVERLAGRAGELMRRISGERYSRLDLDRDFRPSLVSASGETFGPAELSQGTLDQLHLALRLAITDDFTSGQPALMILDDVLINCDQARLVMVRRLLGEMAAQGRQILLLSHDPRYRDWGQVARDLDYNRENSPAPRTRRAA